MGGARVVQHMKVMGWGRTYTSGSPAERCRGLHGAALPPCSLQVRKRRRSSKARSQTPDLLIHY